MEHRMIRALKQLHAHCLNQAKWHRDNRGGNERQWVWMADGVAAAIREVEIHVEAEVERNELEVTLDDEEASHQETLRMLENARQRAEQAEAACAAMREALALFRRAKDKIGGLSYDGANEDIRNDLDHADALAKAALSPAAGQQLLERLRELEAAVSRNFNCTAFLALSDAYKAAPDNDTLCEILRTYVNDGEAFWEKYAPQWKASFQKENPHAR